MVVCDFVVVVFFGGDGVGADGAGGDIFGLFFSCSRANLRSSNFEMYIYTLDTTKGND